MSNVVCRILPVLSADAEKVAELKVSLSLESLMSNKNLCLLTSVFTRDSIYAIARICHGNSVCPSVCHTGGSVKSV